MNAEDLRMLWQATLALTAALILVLVLRAPLRRLAGAQIAYLLWLLPPISLLAGLLPPPTVLVPVTMHQIAGSATAPPGAGAMQKAAVIDIVPWLPLLWLAGAAAAAIVLWHQQRRFVRALGEVRPLTQGLWQAQCGEGCPAVIGVMPPRLVLPPDFESRYAEGERELILAHERAHIARGDTFANALAALLRGLFWFHPLLHYAVARFRQDQELACDLAVLRRFPQARRSYAEAMLKTQLAVLGLPVGCHWQSSHPLKERIAMLKHPWPNPVRRVLGFGIAVVLTLVGGYTAWAAQPAQMKVQASAAKQNIQAVFEQRVDSGAAHTFKVINPVGQSFAFRNEDGGSWEGEFVVTDAGSGKWQMSGTLKRDGKVVSHPKLIVDEGVEARILIGKVAGEHMEGLDLKVTLTVADDASIDTQPDSRRATTVETRSASAEHRPATYRRIAPVQWPAGMESLHGTIVLRVKVASGGAVNSAAFERAAPPAVAPLKDAAIAAVTHWTFEPAQHDGKAVDSEVRVPLEFGDQTGLTAAEVPADGIEMLDAIQMVAPAKSAVAKPPASQIAAAPGAATQASVTAMVVDQRPQGVEVDSVALSGNAATLKGIAPSNALVSKFLGNLDTSGRFTSVDLVSVGVKAHEGTRVMAYEIALKVK